MLQHSKLYQSRNNWQKKAVERAEKIREYRKTVKRHKGVIFELKKEIVGLKEELEEKNIKKI